MALTIVSFSSCSKDEIFTQPDFGQVKGVQWQLVALDTVFLVSNTLYPADNIFLVFEDSRDARGLTYGRCGNYFDAIYTLSGGNSIRIDSLSSTEAICIDCRYWDYIYRFNKINSFEVIGFSLYLYSDGKKQRLVFEKTQ